MEQNEGNGPDGSSLRPVSSLLARFENISKPGEEGTQQQKPPSRPISPAPKPERLKDLKLDNEQAAPVSSAPISSTPSTPTTPTIPTRPKPKPAVAPSARQQEADAAAATPPPIPLNKPSLAPKPQVSKPQTPAVTVQPPLSPPKVSSPFVDEDHSTFLNPDSVANSSVSTHSTGPAKPLNRPTTPTPAVPPPRSPRGSRPPSPPPPRRSGETKREPKVAPPPPAPRREKALAPEASALRNGPSKLATQSQDVSQETSPFNSPPGSPKADEEEARPDLPTRPRPQNAPDPRVRPKSAMGSFDPPPVHHSIAVKRRERTAETNGYASSEGYLSHTEADTQYGSLPKSSQSPAPARPISVQHTPGAPPPPPRPVAAEQAAHPEPQQALTPGRRASSNPATQQMPLPPTRTTHGRSKTMDRSGHTQAQAQAQAQAPSPAPAPRTVQAAAASSTAKAEQVMVYPDCSSTNRRPPYMKRGVGEISTKYDARIFDVCGELVCASGQLTRLWNILEGEMLMSYAHTEGVKATAVAFKPAANPQDEGSALWVGTNTGELMEVDLETHTITPGKGNVHQRREVMRIFRHYNELWTMDELGSLHVWGPDESGTPNLTGYPHQSYKLPREHTFSMVVGDELWHATGKEIRVFAPTLDGHVQFQVLIRPLTADGAGEVTSGTMVKTQPDKVYFGHSDGKVSIFSTKDYACLGLLNISTWKINALAGVGHRMWIGYNTGRACVYDIGDTPWTILKEWQAHTNPIIGMKCDPASAYRNDRMQVVSLGADNKIKSWDGLLEDDWVEDEMKSKDTSYCDFDELRALVFTWNAGASTPSSLRYSANDGVFFPEMLQSSGSPDILIFGFQELVDLEDKTATAKRFLKVKKKEKTPQESMSHQYRDWKNFLLKTLDDYMPADDLYHLLHTAPLVGLFTCIFVKASLRDRIRNLQGAEVKRGMGGLHGNKGAVAVRFQIDDSSVCFVNCHLAAGQSQAQARHNDIAEILEADLFPAARDHEVRIDSFAGGGDGTMVVDHELCILNGDLNYRIDTMSRDTVVAAVKQNNLNKLLDRDQLLVARRRNPAFRLRAFEELPITFAPTYKYDVGTDRYDTSEKRRSPAWCDRVLFRGRGRVQQHDYQRHEVYVSDHRPVTGSFSLWVKKIRPRDRAQAWMESQQSFEAVRQQETADEKLHYLMAICGFDDATSRRLIKEKTPRKIERSPSRTREAY